MNLRKLSFPGAAQTLEPPASQELRAAAGLPDPSSADASFPFSLETPPRGPGPLYVPHSLGSRVQGWFGGLGCRGLKCCHHDDSGRSSFSGI